MNVNSSWENLTKDVTLQIFSLLPFNTLLNVPLVNKRWRSLVLTMPLRKVKEMIEIKSQECFALYFKESLITLQDLINSHRKIDDLTKKLGASFNTNACDVHCFNEERERLLFAIPTYIFYLELGIRPRGNSSKEMLMLNFIDLNNRIKKIRAKVKWNQIPGQVLENIINNSQPSASTFNRILLCKWSTISKKDFFCASFRIYLDDYVGKGKVMLEPLKTIILNNYSKNPSILIDNIEAIYFTFCRIIMGKGWEVITVIAANNYLYKLVSELKIKDKSQINEKMRVISKEYIGALI